LTKAFIPPLADWGLAIHFLSDLPTRPALSFLIIAPLDEAQRAALRGMRPARFKNAH